jgi:DNA-binding response OmpR family regulator
MNDVPLVLIVEDSLTQAKKLQAVLHPYPLKVAIADDGLQALKIVDAQHPAVVVLDVNLPTINGYQVCSRIKRNGKTAQIPVIMLTSADSAEATLKGLEVGANDYIPKDSFLTENLLASLNAYLRFFGSAP